MNPERPAANLRVAALYSHPVQYTAPLFRELSLRPGMDLTVYFLSRQGLDATFDPLFGKTFQWDIPLLDGYKHRFLRNMRNTAAVNGFFQLLNFSVIGELRRERYDALLVHGYEHFAKWLAFAAAWSCGTRLIFRGESHLNQPRGRFRRAAKQIVLTNLFRLFDAVTWLGTLNRQYYEYYGVPPGKLYFAPYSVDNRFFGDAVDKLRARRSELRGAIGIEGDEPIVICVGKLIDIKQPLMLLEAFAAVRARRACHLVFVGDGALRGAIENSAARAHIPDVHITGFVNQSQIPEMYASADVFALPSKQEPWGLAVNEAMASGLPVLVTDRVGCAGDLVKDGVNGFVVPYDDVARLTERLETLVADARFREDCGRRSRQFIEGWSVAKTADGIVRACRLQTKEEAI